MALLTTKWFNHLLKRISKILISILIQWIQPTSDNLLENWDNLKGLHKFTKYTESQHSKNLNLRNCQVVFQLNYIIVIRPKLKTAITQLWITEGRRTKNTTQEHKTDHVSPLSLSTKGRIHLLQYFMSNAELRNPNSYLQ